MFSWIVKSVCTGGLEIVLWEIPVSKSVEWAMLTDKDVAGCVFWVVMPFRFDLIMITELHTCTHASTHTQALITTIRRAVDRDSNSIMTYIHTLVTHSKSSC